MPGIAGGAAVGPCSAGSEAPPAALEELCEALFEERCDALCDALLADTLFEEAASSGAG